MIERPTAYPPNGIPFKDRIKKEDPEEEEKLEFIDYPLRKSWIKRILKKLRLTK